MSLLNSRMGMPSKIFGCSRLRDQIQVLSPSIITKKINLRGSNRNRRKALLLLPFFTSTISTT